MTLKFDGKYLCCPHCGENYLHHDKIAVFSRNEDDEHTLRTVVGGNQTSTSVVHSSHSGNPSSRRDGLIIGFWCEICGGLSDLLIAQHKGCTEMFWGHEDGSDT